MCGCRGKGIRNATKGGRTISGPVQRVARSNKVTPAQMAALSMKAAELAGNKMVGRNLSTNEHERRILEKNRRQALKRVGKI